MPSWILPLWQLHNIDNAELCVLLGWLISRHFRLSIGMQGLHHLVLPRNLFHWRVHFNIHTRLPSLFTREFYCHHFKRHILQCLHDKLQCRQLLLWPVLLHNESNLPALSY